MRRRLRHTAVLFLLSLAFVVAPAPAALIPITSDLIVTFSQVPEMVVGDIYHLAMTYDDSIADSFALTSQGTFNNAVTAFSMTRDAGNTGSWDPGSATYSLPATLQTISALSNLYVGVDGTGFPPVTSDDVFGFSINLTLSNTINDTGSGQTIGQQLGGVPVWNSGGSSSVGVQGGGGYIATMDFTSFSVSESVPEPGAGALVPLGAAMLVWVGRRRSRG